jgi:CubicO group peptidase (beta-lactamase class C family)
LNWLHTQLVYLGNSAADIHFADQVNKWIIGGKRFEQLTPAAREELLQSLSFISKQYPEYDLLAYGERHYSNLGYSMLGLSLERAVHMDYSKYIIENICRPLQMNNTTFDLQTYKINGAKGYY